MSVIEKQTNGILSQKFFHKSLTNEYILMYSYNTKHLKQKIPKALLYWIFGGPFLLFAFVITSISGQYLVRPLTFQGILLVPTGFILLYFGYPTLVRWYKKEFRTAFMGTPLFSHMINIFLSIIALCLYISLVMVVWIPSLTLKEQSNLQITIGIPLLLLAILTVVYVVLFYSWGLYRKETQAIIDEQKGFFRILGKTIDKRKFFYEFPLGNNTVYTVAQPIQIIKNTKDSFHFRRRSYNISDNLRIGIFLYYNDKKFLIFSSTSKNRWQVYIDELLQWTKWSYIFKQEPVLIKPDDVELFIYL